LGTRIPVEVVATVTCPAVGVAGAIAQAVPVGKAVRTGTAVGIARASQRAVPPLPVESTETIGPPCTVTVFSARDADRAGAGPGGVAFTRRVPVGVVASVAVGPAARVIGAVGQTDATRAVSAGAAVGVRSAVQSAVTVLEALASEEA